MAEKQKEIIADLQLHSKYSRAVSKYMELPYMAMWAERKGMQLITTGDWQHPLWFEDIKKQLVETDAGVYSLKDLKYSTKFLLVSEISSIFTQGGKGRRVHNLIFSPSIEVCEKIIAALKSRGANLDSDGRPIVGISSKDLLDLLLHIDDRILFLPAHVWTPWFGMYGSKSGFDSIEESFGDLSKYIYAIETGLSSDPAMNWGIKELENRTVVSFSDAHSAMKMGREATVFAFRNKTTDGKFTYNDVVGAIKQDQNSSLDIDFTIEFFPEEGKYHLSGHRAHNVIYSEKDLQDKGQSCPVCGKVLTLGVEHRICTLSYRFYEEKDLLFIQDPVGLTFVHDKDKKKKPFVSMISLIEILQDIFKSKAKAEREYIRLTDIVPEFEILLKMSFEELGQITEKMLYKVSGLLENEKLLFSLDMTEYLAKYLFLMKQHFSIKNIQSTV